MGRMPGSASHARPSPTHRRPHDRRRGRRTDRGHATAAGAFDYVRNGGFEDGADGWAAVGADLDVVGAGVIAPADGAASGRVTVHSPAFVARPQTETDAAPGHYSFTAQVRASVPLDVYVEARSSAGGDSVPGFGVPPGRPVGARCRATFDLPGGADVAFSIGAPLASAATCSTSTTCASKARRLRRGRRLPRPRRPTTQHATAEPDGHAHVHADDDSRRATARAGISVTSSLQNAGFEELDADGGPAAWRQVWRRRWTLRPHPCGRDSTRRASRATPIRRSGCTRPCTSTRARRTRSARGCCDDDRRGRCGVPARLVVRQRRRQRQRARLRPTRRTRLTAQAQDYRWLTTGSVTAPPDAHSARVRVVARAALRRARDDLRRRRDVRSGRLRKPHRPASHRQPARLPRPRNPRRRSAPCSDRPTPAPSGPAAPRRPRPARRASSSTKCCTTRRRRI